MAGATRGVIISFEGSHRVISSIPRVTVLMCVYNGQRYLTEAIESILRQSLEDFEFLIVNDGSTDESLKIIRSFSDPRIRLLENRTNVGLTKSLNRGLAEARGLLVARQDADDVAHRARLEKQVNFLDAHPEVVLVGTQARYIDQDGRFLNNQLIARATSRSGIQWQLMTYSAFIHSSVMFRKKLVWDQLHGYDENFPKRQDYELTSRIASAYPVANLSQALVDCRVHSAMLSASYDSDDIKNQEKIAHNNMRIYLKDSDVPSEWSQLIAWVNNPRMHGTIENPTLILGAIRSMWKRFLQVNPGADSNQDLRCQLARDLIRVSLCLISNNRWSSIRAFAWASRLSLPIAVSLGTKYAPMLLFGESYVRLIRSALRSLVSRRIRYPSL